MRKLRPKEFKSCVQRHIASKCWSPDLSLGSMTADNILFITMLHCLSQLSKQSIQAEVGDAINTSLVNQVHRHPGAQCPWQQMVERLAEYLSVRIYSLEVSFLFVLFCLVFWGLFCFVFTKDTIPTQSYSLNQNSGHNLSSNSGSFIHLPFDWYLCRPKVMMCSVPGAEKHTRSSPALVRHTSYRWRA